MIKRGKKYTILGGVKVSSSQLSTNEEKAGDVLRNGIMRQKEKERND